jgi:cytochrome c oxidase subunit 4
MSQHIAAKKTYFLVYGFLIVLTIVTATVATIDLGPLNIVVALLIAMAKASLVILFFMHMKWSPRLVQIVAVAALFWLAILIALTLSDYRTRHWTPSPAPWETSSLRQENASGSRMNGEIRLELPQQPRT